MHYEKLLTCFIEKDTSSETCKVYKIAHISLQNCLVSLLSGTKVYYFLEFANGSKLLKIEFLKFVMIELESTLQKL